MKQSDQKHLVQNRNQYETALFGEMKRDQTPPSIDRKVIRGVWYKRKEHNDIDLKYEMKSTKLYH